MDGRHSVPSASLNIESAPAVVHLQLREHKVIMAVAVSPPLISCTRD